MKKIPLTQGYSAMVDDADYEMVSRFKWTANVQRNSDGSVKAVYAYRRLSKKDGRGVQYLHRFVLGLGDSGIHCDHRRHDGLDNRRSKLRACTPAQNRLNMRKFSNNTSGCKGVSWSKSAHKWHSYISLNGKRRHLGYFDSKRNAARAYESAAKKLFGEFRYVEGR